MRCQRRQQIGGASAAHCERLSEKYQKTLNSTQRRLQDVDTRYGYHVYSLSCGAIVGRLGAKVSESENKNGAAILPLRGVGMSGRYARPSQDDVKRLTASRGFAEAVGFLAGSFVASHAAAPRMSALFATQPRWLLCLAALARHFRAAGTDTPGVSRRDLGHLALRHGIASRNTAYVFFDEMLKYGILHPVFPEDDTDEVVPTSEALAALVQWCAVHLAALDQIDGGDRWGRFCAESERLLPFFVPLLAEGLLACPDVRMPGPLYRIFAWTDAGGLLMDRLVAGIDRQALQPGGYLTDVSSITHLARAFGLSRAHANRKVAEAESIGGIGWTGRRGHSCIWISRAFYTEYASAQARKLVIFREAFAASEGEPSRLDSGDYAACS